MSGRASAVRFVVAGGGTAGHVLPALAIADALLARGHPPATVHFVGARRGMEAHLVPARGYPGTWLEVRGIQRSLTPANLLAAARFVPAIARGVRLLRALRPAAVVSVGGYASLPAVAAGRLLGIPIVAVSYDVVPGRASLVAARLATATAVAFPGSRLSRAVLTGAPLRPEIAGLDRAAQRARAREALHLPLDRFVVLVVGGSLGSGVLNDVVADLVAARHADRGLAVRHVVGERNARRGLPRRRDGWEGIVYAAVAYEPRMDLAYAAADVVVARAGATTVAELGAVGAPSVLVPWKLAAEDHQTANARVLGDAGAAVVLAEDDLTAARLAAELDALRHDPERLAAMGAAASATGRRDGAARIAELVEHVAEGAAPAAPARPAATAGAR